ncbi:MAG: sugar ABC transporter substrate-binding protein [Anaerolineae bacterium]|nr:sugar ABC transporter substrate-binding protein [Anaerolineae bacterium]
MKLRFAVHIGILLLTVLSFSAPAIAQDDVTIDFWIPGGRGRDEGAAAVIEAFEAQNPHITVELTATPFGEFFDSLQVAFAGNNPPDAALIDGVGVQNLAYNGALLPIEDMFSQEDLDDFMSDLIEMVTLDGRMYGAPWANAADAMYYNVDMFEAAGVEAPKTLEDGWTWAEFVENVNTVRAHQAEQGNEVWGMMGFNNPLQGAFFTWTIIRSASSPGEPLWESIAPDLSTFAGYIDTPEAIEAYGFYQSLYTDGFMPTDNIPDAFPNGLTATFFAIPPTGTVLARNFPDLNWDVMPMPYIKTPITHTGSFAPGVAAKSDNPEEAKAFVKFFTSQEGYAIYHNVTKVVPGRKSMQAQLPDFQEGFLALLFEEMVEWGVARPGGPAHTIFNRIIASDMMVNIALGGDIEEEVANAILEADAQLMQFR